MDYENEMKNQADLIETEEKKIMASFFNINLFYEFFSTKFNSKFVVNELKIQNQPEKFMEERKDWRIQI